MRSEPVDPGNSNTGDEWTHKVWLHITEIGWNVYDSFSVPDPEPQTLDEAISDFNGESS